MKKVVKLLSQINIFNFLFLHCLKSRIVASRTNLRPDLSLVEPGIPITHVSFRSSIKWPIIEPIISCLVVAWSQSLPHAFVSFKSLDIGYEVGRIYVCILMYFCRIGIVFSICGLDLHCPVAWHRFECPASATCWLIICWVRWDLSLFLCTFVSYFSSCPPDTILVQE